MASRGDAKRSHLEASERAPRRTVLCLLNASVMPDVAASISSSGLEMVAVKSTTDAREALERRGDVCCVVCCLGTGPETSCWPILEESCRRFPQLFTVVFSSTVATDCKLRLECYAAGAKMITDSAAALAVALRRVAQQGLQRLEGATTYTCPKCGMMGLSEDELHTHYPLYHGSQANISARCPICDKRTSASRGGPDVHIHNHHGPVELREPPTPRFAAFSWIVCRRASDGKFLMVNEPAGLAGGQPRYWIPAGRVDSGESLVEAALRETLEEAGVEAEVLGVLRFQLSRHTPRVVFLAQPREDSAEPKSIPDFESVGALWVAAEDLKLLHKEDYRSPDPAFFFPAVANGIMSAQSLDTDEFRGFELVIRNLTQDRGSAHDFDAAWNSLKAVYPSETFRER